MTGNQSISSQVKEASSNFKDQGVDKKTLNIFSEINRTILSHQIQLAEMAKQY